MNRSGKFKRRITKPDPLYNSIDINRLIGKINKCGKRIKAEKAVYAALLIVSKQLEYTNIATMFSDLVTKVEPTQILRPWRIASKIYALPIKASEGSDICRKKAIKWISMSIKNSKKYTLVDKIVDELLKINKGNSNSHIYLTNHNNLAIENAAYVHYSK